ncbi:BrxA/BrxB family bacilliredoxin [Gorillibacterium timonense]|uniref:BrxA/BrxB family bacilliredoxin n=1 Tax=Gorillibacterium timonense TaxID=1689269 RepID=UPI00071E60E3|nr:BrxA/BrxB family bacilliredoxin [Gorillibacterium timonense]
MIMSFDQYMRDTVQPMRDELTRIGVKELRTPEEVAEKLGSAEGTALLVINSVCGCAAGQCRPGVAKALEGEVTPDHLFTVFAGQDKEATAAAREQFLAEYPPSSPSIALFKDGKLVHFIQRYQIEDRSADMIANDLTTAFQTFCD